MSHEPLYFREYPLTCVVFADDQAVVARCLDVEVTSHGASADEAIAQLREALELYFEDRPGLLATLPRHRYRLARVVMRSRLS